MASFLTSIKRELNDSSDDVTESQDSFFRRDFDKLKEMLTNLKENKPKADRNTSYEDMTLSSETKIMANRLITKERGLSEDFTDEARKDRHYEEEITNLRNKLEISETRLAKLQDFNSSLFKKLTASETELKKCQEILSKREYLNQVKSLEIEDMNHKITSLSLANQADLESLKKSYEVLKKEMFEKQYEAIRFEQIIKEKDTQIKQLTDQLPEYTLDELENILKENKILREKITETEKSIDNLYMFKTNDSAILLEMDRLKGDIKRLISLLKSTDEFKEFAENANLLNGDVRFLKNAQKEKGTTKNYKQWVEKRNLKSEFENFFWVPTDAYKFANDFRVKYQGHFTEEIIESLLFEINKLWKDKHEKSLSKLKEKYELKLMNLRQQYATSNIQSSIVNQKMISRLKGQVQKSSKDLETLKKNKKIDGFEALNTTLKAATRDHHRLKSLEIENKRLNSQLQSIVDNSILTKQSKPEFIEGASWIYGKIKKELDGLIEICSDLIQDYEAKLQQILTEFPEREETNMILARSKWLIDGVETTLSSFYETVKNLESQIVLPYATIADYTSANTILTKDYHS